MERLYRKDKLKICGIKRFHISRVSKMHDPSPKANNILTYYRPKGEPINITQE